MPSYRISTIASLLSVSDDTVRRWLDEGLIVADEHANGPRRVDGASVAAMVKERPEIHQSAAGRQSHSMRNHLPGLVTAVTSDPVMSQVELQCGPYKVVSLSSTQAVRELELVPGTVATAQIKATNVSIATQKDVS